MKTTAAALVLAGLLTGCTGADASRIEVTRWDVAPQTPAIGVPARATVALHDGRGPLRRARLEVEAHMAHPGMTPVIVPAHERDGDPVHDVRPLDPRRVCDAARRHARHAPSGRNRCAMTASR